MGQYHELFARDPQTGTIETIKHYPMGCGAKLLEQAWSTSPHVGAFGLLAMSRWRGWEFIVVGDYAEPDDSPAGWPTAHELYDEQHGRNSYDEEKTATTDVTELAMNLIGEAAGWEFGSRDLKGRWTPHAKLSAERKSGWMDCRNKQIGQLTEQWLSGAHEPTVLAASNGEYLRPEALGSPFNALHMPLCGGAWPAAYLMLAISDGKGGGDSRLEPAGRWGGLSLGVIPADAAEGLVDVTDWFLEQTSDKHWGLTST